MTGSIAAGASDDYEVLRDQLFGVERPGVRAGGFSVLIRCGLAAWARHRHEPLKALRPESNAPAAAPAQDEDTRAVLARLIANLILTPKESPSCQM